MFQTFEAATHPNQGPPRLAALRAQMAHAGLDGFLVPRADAHQGEYVAPCDERLAWLTGFTGSAGFCAVLADVAGVFIDGRYRVQVKAQVADDFTPVAWPEVQLHDWLRSQMPKGGTVGFDPWLHTPEQIEKLENGLVGSGITLQRCANLVDAVWADRPAPPCGAIEIYPIEYAGEKSTNKRARLAETLRNAGQSGAVITLPDSLCWLLNIRGSDIVRNPVVHGFGVLHGDGRFDLFTDAPVTDALTDHLGGDVTMRPKAEFTGAIAALPGAVRIDKTSVPVAVADAIKTVQWGDDPCVLPKARKNAAEIAGSRAAHLRDGVAMVEFLAWLDLTAPSGQLTEIDVVTELEVMRRANNALRDISFETIAGSGPNGAIIHYRVTNDTNRKVEPGALLLVDSGGQYHDGTTDITRTIAVGDIGLDEKQCYTRVLKGLIALSQVRWPKGLAGRDLDALARYPLWLAGQDYDHGTGHGVGAYLSVHEGPQRISRVSHVPLEPGMIVSNEPGYYREGHFGIRLENLIVVRSADPVEGGDDRKMLSFETLTFAPFDKRLILNDTLTNSERVWLNAYHAEVCDKLMRSVSEPAQGWLKAATSPI